MKLQHMRDIDIREKSRDDVVQAENVIVNMELPVPERMLDTARQMNGNPYFFLFGNTLVKVSHIQTPVTLSDRCESYMRTL